MLITLATILFTLVIFIHYISKCKNAFKNVLITSINLIDKLENTIITLVIQIGKCNYICKCSNWFMQFVYNFITSLVLIAKSVNFLVPFMDINSYCRFSVCSGIATSQQSV